jgi:hypothetical protein
VAEKACGISFGDENILCVSQKEKVSKRKSFYKKRKSITKKESHTKKSET